MNLKKKQKKITVHVNVNSASEINSLHWFSKKKTVHVNSASGLKFTALFTLMKSATVEHGSTVQ
jgi:hypothetical protein